MIGTSIHVADAVAALAIVLGLLVGFLRGGIWMLFRIALLAAAYGLARIVGDDLGRLLAAIFSMTPRAGFVLGTSATFVGAGALGLLGVALLGRGVDKAKPKVKSRVLGAAMGAVVATALFAIGAVLWEPTLPKPKSNRLLLGSAAVRRSAIVLGEVPFLLPSSLRGHLKELASRAKRAQTAAARRGNAKPAGEDPRKALSTSAPAASP